MDGPEPGDAQQAPIFSIADDWAESIYNEIVSLMKREVFEVVDLSEGRKVLKSSSQVEETGGRKNEV